MSLARGRISLTYIVHVRADNQICESFFKTFKADIVKGGPMALSSVIYEQYRVLIFQSQQDSKELTYLFEPIVTNKMWTFHRWNACTKSKPAYCGGEACH